MKKSPYPRIALSIILFASGFLAHALFFKSKPPAPEKSVAAAPSQNAEIDSLNTELAELQTAYASLQTQIEQPVQIEESHFSEGITISSNSASGVVAMPFSDEHFERMMKAQVNGQLDIYAARLNLSASQRSQLEEIMLLQFSQMGPMMGGQFMQEGGETSDSPRITQSDIDDLASEILSDEQLAEYEKMRAQENASRSEMMATAQLSQIAPQLGLSEEQKNQAYGIYYDQSIDMQTDTFDPRQFQEAQNQSNERISEILDDQQKAIFKQLNENQSFGNFTVIAQ